MIPEASSAVTENHRDDYSETYSSESVVDTHSDRGESVKDDFESIAEHMIRSQASSEMVFPKLPVESPVHSLEHLPLPSAKPLQSSVPASPASESSSSHKTFALSEDGDIEEEVDLGSDSFLTDDEYDVLDASDEEFEDCERII